MKALDGGETGLNVIKLILNTTSDILLPGGKLFLEVDSTQPSALIGLMPKDLRIVGVFRDFCNNDRFVVVEKTTLVK